MDISNRTKFVQFAQSGEPMTNPPIPEPNKKSKMILWIIIGVVILVLVFAIVALATKIWDPLWNPFRPKPEAVINKMVVAMDNAKIYHIEAEVGANFKGTVEGQSGEIDLKGTINGDANLTNPNDPEGQATAGVGATIKAGGGGMDFNMSVSFSGEAKATGGNYYFKIGKLNAPFFLSMLEGETGFDPASAEGVWYKLSKEAVEKMQKENTGSELPPLTDNQQKVLAEKIKELWKTSKIYTAKELKGETIKGKPSYKYNVSLDKDGFIKFLDDLAERKMTEKDKTELKTVLDKAGDLGLDLWIGKQDFLLYRVIFEKKFDMNLFEDQFKPGQLFLTLKVQADLSDYGKAFKVEVPAKTMDLGEILMQQREKAINARIQADLNQMRSYAEWMKDEKGGYVEVNCSVKSKTGYYDTNTMEALCADIKTQTGSEPVIKNSKNSYCAYAKLSGENGYYCVNSQLKSNKTNIDPATVGYCTGKTFNCPPAPPVTNGLM